MTDDDNYLITMRVVDYPGLTGKLMKRSCFMCLSSVWIEPNSPYWTLVQVRVVCTRCAPKVEGLGEQGLFQPFTEAQRLAIVRETGLYGDQIDRFAEEVVRPRIFGPQHRE